MSKITLRPYQQKTIEKTLRSLSIGENPLNQLPTGAGKTFIIAAIADAMINKGHFIGILSHKKELQKQILSAIEVYSGEKSEEIRKHIHIFNPQKKNVGFDTERPVLLIVDECHHSIADTWHRYIEKYPRVGFTATPKRLNQDIECRQLYHLYNTLHIGVTKKELINLGYWPEPIIYSGLELVVNRKNDGNTKEYSKIELNYISCDENNKIVVSKFIEVKQLENLDFMKTICFACSVFHAQSLKQEYNDNGIKADAIHSKMSSNSRNQILKQFNAGEIEVLINVLLFSEGLDIPDLTCVLIARPTKSLALYEQMTGRLMRCHTNKKKAILIDLTDNMNRLWDPAGMVDIAYILDRGIGIYEIQEGLIIEANNLKSSYYGIGGIGHPTAEYKKKGGVHGYIENTSIDIKRLIYSDCIKTMLEFCNSPELDKKDRGLIFCRAIRNLWNEYGEDEIRRQEAVLSSLIEKMFPSCPQEKREKKIIEVFENIKNQGHHKTFEFYQAKVIAFQNPEILNADKSN